MVVKQEDSVIRLYKMTAPVGLISGYMSSIYGPFIPTDSNNKLIARVTAISQDEYELLRAGRGEKGEPFSLAIRDPLNWSSIPSSQLYCPGESVHVSAPNVTCVLHSLEVEGVREVSPVDLWKIIDDHFIALNEYETSSRNLYERAVEELTETYKEMDKKPSMFVREAISLGWKAHADFAAQFPSAPTPLEEKILRFYESR